MMVRQSQDLQSELLLKAWESVLSKETPKDSMRENSLGNQWNLLMEAKLMAHLRELSMELNYSVQQKVSKLLELKYPWEILRKLLAME